MLSKRESAQPVLANFSLSGFNMPIALHLAFKEIWRNRGRFFLISLVIALITTLVLFVAGLAEGLGAGNREYLEKLNAELLIYRDNVDLSIASSQFDRSELREFRRVAGVKAVGSIGFSNAAIVFATDQDPLKISLIGVEPGLPGEPPAIDGRGLEGSREKEAMIDRNVALRTGLAVGDRFWLKTLQGGEEEFYEMTVVGLSDGRQYSLQPTIFVPYLAWDEVKPKSLVTKQNEQVFFNLVAIQLEAPDQLEAMAARLEAQVRDIQAVDRVTAYESTPGYSAQQSTLNTQRIFTLLIGVLVVGGFFQIQTLQKVSQIGMLKAIGASNWTIGLAFLVQIVIITILGVALGGLGTLALSLGFPPTVPIVFSRESVLAAIGSLLIIGPLGGLVSIRILLKVEPLTALGLSS